LGPIEAVLPGTQCGYRIRCASGVCDRRRSRDRSQGRLDFSALQQGLSAGRTTLAGLVRETPASYAAFDVLAVAAPLPRIHEPPEASLLFVILIPIIAGRVLRATRALRAGPGPKFRSALPRRLFPRGILDRSRFPKLHSGPSNPTVTPLSVLEGLRSAVGMENMRPGHLSR